MFLAVEAFMCACSRGCGPEGGGAGGGGVMDRVPGQMKRCTVTMHVDDRGDQQDGNDIYISLFLSCLV